MPLNEFQIENTGPIRLAECSDVPDLMVVAGPNGVGKSTMFEEISNGISGKGGLAQNVQTSESTQSVYLSPHRAPVPSEMSATLLSSLGRESARTKLGSSSYNVNSNDVPNVLQYSNNTRSRKRADFAPYFELKKRLAQFEFDRGQLMAEIYDEKGNIPEGFVPDLGEPLKDGIDAVLPGIEYEGVKQADDREYKIQFNDRSGSVTEFDELSSGEKDAIALIFNLVEKKIESRMDSLRDNSPEIEDILFIIDSPEAYLHPAMQERFLNFVQEEIESGQSNETDSNLQVLMCTHSQSIIQNVSDNQLYFLLYRDQRENNQLVSAEGISVDTLESITGEIGLTALSSGNPLLLVEGKTDREIIRKLFPDKKDSIEILPMGGKGKIIDFSKAFNQIVPELYSKGIFIFALVDRDRDIKVDDLYEDFVFQLSVTCIENHLLDSEALFEALNLLAAEERLEGEDVADPGDIDNHLSKVVDTEEFRQTEVKTRLHEKLRFYIRLDSVEELDKEAIATQIDEVAEKKKSRINDRIESVDEEVSEAIEEREYEKLNGKEILSMVAGSFGLTPDVLARTTADVISSNDFQPKTLVEKLEHISETVETHPTSAAVLKDIKE